MIDIACPLCHSLNVKCVEKSIVHFCKDCDHRFTNEEAFIPRRVFISYGHDEHSILAERLKEDLENRGHKVWFDLEKLTGGSDWESWIEKGLNWVAEDKSRGRVVFLMTPHSTRRPDGFCLNEILKAVSNNLGIIPIMVVFCEPPLSIYRIQWLDMQDCNPLTERQNNYEKKFNQLITALEEDRLDFEGDHNTQLRLLNALKPIDFNADILKYIKEFSGRKWIIQEIEDWIQDDKGQKVFWVTGAPGVGKTAIAAWVRENRPEIAAFHFCSNTQEKNTPSRLVTSIAYMLSTQLKSYKEALDLLDLEQIVNDFKDSLTLFDKLIVQPLSINFPTPDRPVVILIDGLDEASKDGRNELAIFIASEFEKHHPGSGFLLPVGLILK